MLRSGGNMPDQNFGRGTGKSRCVVVFGQPKTPIAQRVSVLGQRYGFGTRLGGICCAGDRRLVENVEDKIRHVKIITKIALPCQSETN